MQDTVSSEARVSDEMTGDEGCAYIPCPDEWPARDIDCRDPAELTANLPEWHWDLTRLEGGEFHARATTIPLEAVFIAKLKFNRALLHRIRPPLGCVSILMFDQSVGAVFVDGHRLAKAEGIVLDPCSNAEILSHGECIVIALSMSELCWRNTTQMSRHDGAALRGGSRLLTCDRNSVSELLGDASSVIQALAIRSKRPAEPGVRSTCCELILARLRAVRRQSRQIHGAHRGRARRIDSVQRARDYILKHLAEPISLSDLCGQTHMQARALEYGFREIVGLSPMSYVRMLRLGEVHRRLLGGVSHHRTISELALDAGFWHLSQFAVDYKKLFMESPSATRRRLAGMAEPRLERVAAIHPKSRTAVLSRTAVPIGVSM